MPAISRWDLIQDLKDKTGCKGKWRDGQGLMLKLAVLTTAGTFVFRGGGLTSVTTYSV
jgi:hypothetical protein